MFVYVPSSIIDAVMNETRRWQTSKNQSKSKPQQKR